MLVGIPKKSMNILKGIIEVFKNNIKTSIFVDPNLESVEYAKKTNCDAIELYTELYAKNLKKIKLKL